MREARPFTGAEILEAPEEYHVKSRDIIIHAIPGGILVESIVECLRCWIDSVAKCFKKKDS